MEIVGLRRWETLLIPGDHWGPEQTQLEREAKDFTGEGTNQGRTHSLF